MKQKGNRDLIKIKYKCEEKSKNKVFNRKDLGYVQFAQKLANNLGLEKTKYYRLYYIDQLQEYILINTPQDYEIFLQTTENLILHLQETKDQQINFRKAQKAVQSQKMQQLRVALKKKQEEVSSQQKKINQFENYKDIIQKKRNKMLKQLQEFKNKLQEETSKQLLKGLTKINQKQRLRAGTFIHKVCCQNKACTKDRKILGLKNWCLECQADFCSQCAQEQFIYLNTTHDPKHPILKVRNNQWELFQNRIQKQFREGILEQKIAQLKDLNIWSQEQVHRFVYNYPHLDAQQLIDKALTNPKELKSI